MGCQNKKCSVMTLNYSGIYLSPFEYYAIDNWQELQRIGRIFQRQLQQEFDNIRAKNLKYEGTAFKDVKQYSRKTFQWQIGNIDKVIHEHRYTPIYTSKDNIQKKKFAGIATKTKQNITQQYLMDQALFLQNWYDIFDKLQDNHEIKQDISDKLSDNHETKDDIRKEIIKTAKESNKLHKYNCFMFDFLCYKSIILYLFTTLQDDGKRLSYKEDNTHQFQDIVRQSLKYSHHPIVELYKDFMTRYFEIIDTQKKISLTIDSIFQKRSSPSIVTFTEATPSFRKQLQKLQKYFFYGPIIKNKTKQTLILLKKDLPFIPSGYDIDGYHYKLDKFKKQMAPQLSEFLQPFEKFWNQYFEKINKSKQSKEYEAFGTFMQALKKNFLFWTEDCQVVEFTDTGKKIIIGAFHLNSKAEINSIEVQLLGLLIYQLVQIKGYRFIFAGNFNSYITISQKDNALGLFSFVAYQNLPINNLTNNIKVYPKHPKIITTKKKRTILQVQTRKVNDLAQKSIDQVISNYTLDYDLSHVCEVKDIGSKVMNNESFLPHKQHPYDHFLVQAFLNLT